MFLVRLRARVLANGLVLSLVLGEVLWRFLGLWFGFEFWTWVSASNN